MLYFIDQNHTMTEEQTKVTRQKQYHRHEGICLVQGITMGFEMIMDSVEFEYLFNKVKLITNKQIAVNTVYMTQIISDWERLLLCLQSRCSSNHCCDAII